MIMTENIENKLRDYLKKSFEDKLTKTPNYSLRAYAKFIGINPATLSQILNGQRPITKKRAEFFIQRLDLNEDMLKKMYCSRSAKAVDHKELSVDYFLTISEWFYDAILELTHLKGFIPDLKWISSKIGLNYNTINLAVERLKRLELLKCSQEKWIDQSEHNLVAFDNIFSNSALKKYQKQILNKSIESIDNVTRGEREHTSFVLSLDDHILDEVHLKIKNFQKEMVEYIENNSKDKNLVQVIHFGSFPITKLDKNKEKK